MIFDLSMHFEHRHNIAKHRLKQSADCDWRSYSAETIAYAQVIQDLEGLSESVEFMIINGVEFRRT